MSAPSRAARVLIADDNPDNVFVLEHLLKHAGHEVVITRNGADAIARVHSDRPDLILMDLDMPVMDGWEACRRLKNDPDTRGIRIIALSAHALVGDQEKAILNSADDFIPKPFAPDEVLAKIEAVLRNGASGASQ